MRQPIRIIYLLIGWISFVLGIVGLFLPVLPTTPFLILTAYCFSKGSERLHGWLLNLPHLGESIRLWERHGVIGRRGKVLACTMILASIGGTIAFVKVPPVIKIGLALIGASASIFITSRPSEPQKAESSHAKS